MQKINFKYKIFFLTIFLFFGFFLFANAAFAATYYVDNSCTSNGDGTTQACGLHGPFNSLANAQNAVRGSQSDTRLLFKAGQTFSGQFKVGAYGTAGHPFVISSYGAGSKPLFSSGIMIVNLSNIIVDGVQATGGTYGIAIERISSGSSASGIIIRNSVVYNNASVGIMYYNDWGIGRLDGSGSEIHDNEIYGNAAGIYTMRTDFLKIYNNTIRDGTLHSNYEEYGIAVEGGSNLEIRDNLIYNVYTNGIGIYGDSGRDGHSDYNKIYRNVVYGLKYNVWIRDIAWQGDVGTNNQLYYNVAFSSDPRADHFMVDPNSASTGNVLYGNVFYGGNRGAWITGGSQSWTFKNNIFAQNGGNPVSANGTIIFFNNLYYKSVGGTLVSYNGANYTASNIASLDAKAQTTDPKFIGSSTWLDFRLQSGSPAINAGANLGINYNSALDPDSTTWPTSSIDQNSDSSGWEIGAFFFKGSPTPTPTPTFSKCDQNHDTSINVLDLQSLANVILGKNTCTPSTSPSVVSPSGPTGSGSADYTCDLNQDSSVNVLDLQYLANVILGKSTCG